MKISHPLFMSMSKTKYTTSAFLITCYLSVFSQENTKSLGPLVTDRPDVTESSSTVPAGYIQVETGSFYESFEENQIKTETYTYNTTLVRLGVSDNLEFRLGWDFVENRMSNLDNVLSGFNPLLLGAKVAITEEKGIIPEIALIGHIFLPFTAGNDYKPETTGVNFRFSLGHTLNENSSLSYNLGARWVDDSSEATYIYTIAYGIGLTEKLGFYAELYGDLPENNRAYHLWDAGFTYLLSDNVQLDATVGSSISKGQDILLSGGISFRLPTKKH